MTTVGHPFICANLLLNVWSLLWEHCTCLPLLSIIGWWEWWKRKQVWRISPQQHWQKKAQICSSLVRWLLWMGGWGVCQQIGGYTLHLPAVSFQPLPTHHFNMHFNSFLTQWDQAREELGVPFGTSSSSAAPAATIVMRGLKVKLQQGHAAAFSWMLALPCLSAQPSLAKWAPRPSFLLPSFFFLLPYGGEALSTVCSCLKCNLSEAEEVVCLAKGRKSPRRQCSRDSGSLKETGGRTSGVWKTSGRAWGEIWIQFGSHLHCKSRLLFVILQPAIDLFCSVLQSWHFYVFTYSTLPYTFTQNCKVPYCTHWVCSMPSL